MPYISVSMVFPILYLPDVYFHFVLYNKNIWATLRKSKEAFMQQILFGGKNNGNKVFIYC